MAETNGNTNNYYATLSPADQAAAEESGKSKVVSKPATINWEEELDENGFPTTESKANDPKEAENRCLYVKNIPTSIPRATIKKNLSSMSRQYGEVENVYRGDDETTWALIFMKDHKGAVAAIRGLDKRVYKSQPLHVSWAHKDHKNQKTDEEQPDPAPKRPIVKTTFPNLKGPSWADEVVEFSATPKARFVDIQHTDVGTKSFYIAAVAKPAPIQTPHNDKNPPGLTLLPIHDPMVQHQQQWNNFSMPSKIRITAASTNNTFNITSEVTFQQWQTFIQPMLNSIQEMNLRSNGYSY